MNYTSEDIGCYFDGAFGFEYNALRLLFLAGSHGFTYTTIDLTNPSDEDYELFLQEVDDAEKYLNDNTTRPENTFWSWEDGDFGLWQYDEDGELR